MHLFQQLIQNRIPTFALAVGIMACLASAAYCADISQDQKNRLKDLAAQTRQKTREERRSLMRARRELFEVYRNYDLNEKKARAAIEKIHHSQLKLLLIHLDNQVGIRDILNANQFAELRNRIGNKMHGRRSGALNPMRDDYMDKLVDNTILEDVNLSAGQRQKALQLSRLAKQKYSIVKNLRQDSKQMSEMYAVYDLNVSAAKKLINSMHRQQSNLLNLNLKKQQVLREVLTESQFKTLSNRIPRQ